MRLHDSVLHRIVQIVQEGIIMGVDVADLMRLIRLVPHQSEEGVLVLDPEYVVAVEKEHQRAVAEAEAKKETSAQGTFFFD